MWQLFRHSFVSLVVVAEGFSIPNAALALDCPTPPTQIANDTRLEIEGALGALKNLVGGNARTLYEKKASEVYSNYPNADRLVLKNLMISIFCQQLKDSSKLSESERFALIFDFTDRIVDAASPEGEADQFPDKSQISFLQQAFANEDPASARIAISRAIESESPFMQNLALRALFGGLKKSFSGELYYRDRTAPFLIEIGKFNEFDATFTGEFVNWDEQFKGQLSGTVISIVGSRYSFNVELKNREIMEGTSWEGCISGSPYPGCARHDRVVLRLF